MRSAFLGVSATNVCWGSIAVCEYLPIDPIVIRTSSNVDRFSSVSMIQEKWAYDVSSEVESGQFWVSCDS